MKVTHLYTGEDEQSHFEDLDLPLDLTPVGLMSSRLPTEHTFFRDTSENGPREWSFHVAPRRQFVIHLAGVAEIEVADGTKRRFEPGEVLLADDLTGQGHISREVEGPRVQLFVVLADDVDVSGWRPAP